MVSSSVPTTSVHPQPTHADEAGAAGVADDSLVTEELLVEEISIDGMCGVY